MSSSKSQTPGPAPDAPSGEETSNQMQRTWAREPVVEPEPAPGTSPIPKPVLEVGPEFSISEPEPEREPEPEFAPGECSPESHPHPQLPPLSPEEFRVYNRLAEQMELFVWALSLSLILSFISHEANTSQARPLPHHLGDPPRSLHNQPPPPRHVPQAIHQRRSPVSSVPDGAPQH